MRKTTLSASLMGPLSFAQDHHDEHHYLHYHLSPPPRGYEWRSVDGNYVLAAVATGVIASAVVASTIH